MANIFTITTVAQTLKADANGNVTTVFTVTNSTSRPIRGIPRIKSLSNTQAQWLKIDGETERDFPAGGTHQFTVNFNKPKPPTSPNTPQPAESFPFRFDVASATNPDEDFTEGPVVTVEIPEQIVKEKKPFLWWIAAVAAVLLIVVGVVLWLVLRNPEMEVPDVTNKTYTEAETELKAKGFTAVKIDEIAPDKPLDTVFKQDPPAETKVSSDKNNVKLSVPATTEVPDVTNKTYAEAETELKAKGFTAVKIDEIAPDKPLDTVFKQDLIGITKTAPNSTVKLSVPATTTVPLLRNLTLNDSINRLKSNELKIGTITGDGDAIRNGSLNQVSSQNPPEKTLVAKGSEVSVGFPCVNNPPFRRCLAIVNFGTLNQAQINPGIRRQIELANPRFRVEP